MDTNQDGVLTFDELLGFMKLNPSWQGPGDDSAKEAAEEMWNEFGKVWSPRRPPLLPRATADLRSRHPG